MLTFNIATDSPNQSGYVPEFFSQGTGSAGELFSQDASMAIWVRPVVESGEALTPWEDDYVTGDTYYFAIGNPDDRATGGTFDLAFVATAGGNAYNVPAATLVTQIDAISNAAGYGGVDIILLTEGVYQVTWQDFGAVPVMTSNASNLLPACEVRVVQVSAGSGSEYAQQIIDIRQTPVATATISTAYVPTEAEAALITAPSATTNAVWSVDFGDVFAGYITLSITAGGILSDVNVTPYMSSTDFGLALALHPAIYYQDAVEPDNISVEVVNGVFLITFIGTLAGSTTARTISGITVAAAAVVTTTAAHGYVTGDSVVISGTDSTPVINGTRVVTVLSSTTFSVPVTTTVSGATGTCYNTSQPFFEQSDTTAIYPKGNTGTLNLNTFALYKAFCSTTSDEITYSLQIKRVRTSGESKTIFGEDIVLKRELIDVGTMIDVPTTGLNSLTLGAEDVATGTLIIAGAISGAVTITTSATAGTWTLTLPANDGTASQVLITDGNGVTSWSTLSVAVGSITGLGAGVATALGVTTNAAGGFTTTDGTATLSGKTLTAPKFADLGFIADANGNELLIFDTVTSAVNELTLANAATGGMPTISATGGDTNIHAKFTPKGTGGLTFTAGTRANPTIRFDTANNSGGQNEIGICNYFQNVASLSYNGNSNFEWGAGGVIMKNSTGSNRINCESSQLLVGGSLAVDWSGGFPIFYTAGTEVARATSTGFTLAGALIGTPQSLSGAGAVNVTTTTTAFTATAPAHALTLANGTAGQIKTVCMVATSGGGTGILTPTTKTGYTTITFNAAGDSVMLQYFTTAGWCIIGSRGVAIA